MAISNLAQDHNRDKHATFYEDEIVAVIAAI